MAEPFSARSWRKSHPCVAVCLGDTDNLSSPESAASKGKAVTKPLGSPPKFNLPNASDDVFAAPAPAHVSPAGTNAVVPYTQQPAHYATTDLVDGKDPQHVFPIEACIFLAKYNLVAVLSSGFPR